MNSSKYHYSKNEGGIRGQILDVCMELFDMLLDSINQHEKYVSDIMPQGIPMAMIIAEFNSCTRSMNKIKNGHNSREIVQAWKYSNKELKSIPLNKEPDLNSNWQEYYRETYARFAFDEKKKVLYLNIFYAPLYARCWKYELIETADQLILGEAKLEWLS